MNPFANRVVKGYEILDLIDEGGFSLVYRAMQSVVEREVAVKVILPKYANDPNFIRRFETEAQLVARLEHLHIVPLYDYWRDPSGAFLVMRWLRGGTVLSSLKSGEEWSLASTTRLVEQIASALSTAHLVGVIHRDLKPGNILLDEQKNSYLTDFGIAFDSGNPAQAHETSMIGSPGYISPEQIRGETVSPLSDQYSFGILIFQVLAGVHPFETEFSTQHVLLRHLDQPLPFLSEHRSDLPKGLDSVLMRATAKTPSERYPDVLSFAAAFKNVVQANQELNTMPADEQTLIVVQDDITRDLAIERILPAQENPYKGLRAFQEADAVDFFGRNRLIERILLRLAESNFLAIVGPSGSGKSSVVDAGVIPALRRGAIYNSDQWFFVEMTPNRKPMQELENALLRVAVNRPDSLLEQLNESDRGLVRAIKRVLPYDDRVRLLLSINQFEEVFTQASEEECEHFLNSLAVALRAEDSRLHVIISLRADFYDRPLLYSVFGELVQQQTEVVLPLSYEELEAAIEGPANRVGLQVELGLVNTIIQDVRQQPAALPLLQYALTELFERRDERKMTLKAYQEIGGVSGALIRRAEDVFTELIFEQQQLTRQVFLRLVNVEADDTRRRAYLSELRGLSDDPTAVSRLLELFVKYRLLTFDYDPITRLPTVQIAHEALIRRWARFQMWLDDSREEIQLQRRLASLADEWIQSGQDSSFLASGLRLQQFENWVEHTRMILNESELDYLKRSVIQRERRLAEEQIRKEREEALEKRSRRVLWLLVAVFSVATIVAAVLAGLAVSQRREAQQARITAEENAARAESSANQAQLNAEAAERNANEAQSLAWAAASQLVLGDNNTDLAIALALEATTRITDPPAEAQRALAGAAYSPGTRRIFSEHTDEVTHVVATSDGKTAISSSADGLLIFWDIQSGEIIRTVEDHGAPVRSLVVDPSGNSLLSGDDNGIILLYGLNSNRVLLTLDAGSPVYALAYGGDGLLAASGSANGQIILWNMLTGSKILEWTSVGGEVWSVAFGRENETLFSGASSGVVSQWDLSTGELMNRFEGHGGAVRDIAVSLNGRQLLTAADDGFVYRWDVRTGEVLGQFEGHVGAVYSVIFSDDGQTAVTGSQDSTIRLWEVERGTEILRLDGHTSGVADVTYLPNQSQLLSASLDHHVRLWDTLHGSELGRFTVQRGDIYAVAYSPDGRRALTGGADRTLYYWDISQGRLIKRIQGNPEAIRGITFLPNGERALVVMDDDTMLLWDLEREIARVTYDGHTDIIQDIAVNRDGTLALTGSRDNTAILWNVETGEMIQRLEGHTNWIRGVALSQDGKTALTGSADTTVILWNVETGEIIHQMQGHTDWVWDVAMTRDGLYGISGGSDGLILYWDLTTGQMIRQIQGHNGSVFKVIFSLDRRAVLSSSADRTVRAWDLATGAEIGRVTGHTGSVYALALEPFGRQMLTGAGDGTIRRWNAPYSFNEVIEWTFANRYVRELNCVERSVYRVLPLCDE